MKKKGTPDSKSKAAIHLRAAHSHFIKAVVADPSLEHRKLEFEGITGEVDVTIINAWLAITSEEADATAFGKNTIAN